MWLWGGVALIASAIVQFAFPSNLSGRQLISALLLTAALMLFAFGGGVRRNIFGGDVIAPVAAVLLSALMIATGIIGLMPNDGGPEWNQLWVSSLIGIARLTLTIVLAVQVGRSPVLASKWRWAPLWAVFAQVVSWMFWQFGLINAATIPAELLPWVMSWAGVIAASVPIFVGVLAILVAQQHGRPETEPSQLDQASDRQLAHR
jgi:hypothetical protein